MADKQQERMASIPQSHETLNTEIVLKSFHVGKDGKTIGEIGKTLGIKVKFLNEDLRFNIVSAKDTKGNTVEYRFGEPRIDDVYAIKKNPITGVHYLSRTRGNETYTIQLTDEVMRNSISLNDQIRAEVFGTNEEIQTA